MILWDQRTCVLPPATILFCSRTLSSQSILPLTGKQESFLALPLMTLKHSQTLAVGLNVHLLGSYDHHAPNKWWRSCSPDRGSDQRCRISKFSVYHLLLLCLALRVYKHGCRFCPARLDASALRPEGPFWFCLSSGEISQLTLSWGASTWFRVKFSDHSAYKDLKGRSYSVQEDSFCWWSIP